MKELRISFNAPLSSKDSPSQTYGCRANNPDICLSNMLPEIVACLIDALIQEDEINISPKRMCMTNETKMELIVSKRKDVLSKAISIPAKLDLNIHIDDRRASAPFL